MRAASPYPHRGVVGRHDEVFQDVLYDQIRKTPWWLVSIGLHVVLIFLAWNIEFSSGTSEENSRISASNLANDFEELVDEPPPVDEIPPIDPEFEPIDDPTIHDIPAEDPADEEEYDESKEESDLFSEAPFDGMANNADIGIGGSAGGMSGGIRGRRKLRMELAGETVPAVDLGLEWLKNHQDPEGYWDCDGFEAQCKLNKCGGAGAALFDPGVSGLALLAFLGAGETHQTGNYRETVRNGLKYLKQIQDPEGCFGPRTTTRFTYNHAVASLAMAEAYALTGSPLFKQSAQSAIDFIEKCRNPYLAWRYGVRPQDNDTSVTGWMVMALKSAREAGGLRVPEEAFDGAKAWIEKVTEPEYGKVGYTARGTGPARPEDIMDRFPADRSEALTAVGILTRIFLGENPETSEAIRKGTELCVKVLPRWDESDGSIDMYYWYYGSLAMFQVGGEAWRAWNSAMKPEILDHQRMDGDQKGSWDPIGPWGREGGRVYSTAVCVMCLEVYYRYDRVFGAGGKHRGR
jgi:hypothetical protein